MASALAMGSNPVEVLKFFFGLKFAIALIVITTAMVKSSFHLYFCSSYHLRSKYTCSSHLCIYFTFYLLLFLFPLSHRDFFYCGSS